MAQKRKNTKKKKKGGGLAITLLVALLLAAVWLLYDFDIIRFRKPGTRFVGGKFRDRSCHRRAKHSFSRSGKQVYGRLYLNQIGRYGDPDRCGIKAGVGGDDRALHTAILYGRGARIRHCHARASGPYCGIRGDESRARDFLNPLMPHHY